MKSARGKWAGDLPFLVSLVSWEPCREAENQGAAENRAMAESQAMAESRAKAENDRP